MPYDNNSDLCIPTDLAITDAIKDRVFGLKVCLVVQNSQNSVQLKGIITDGDVRRGILSGIDLNDKCTRVMNNKPLKCPHPPQFPKLNNRLLGIRLGTYLLFHKKAI